MEDVSEWEYEYDEHETEDLYFTLDLTTHVPDAVPIAKIARNGKPVPRLAPPAREQTLLEPGKLQILDLHTKNPFVKFNDGVYSCHWHTDLGTQIHVVEQGAIADPVRKGHVLDVVATSQTRLLAEPVTLKARPGAIDLTSEEHGEVTSTDAPVAASPAQPLPPSDLSTLQPGQQLVVPPEVVKNPVMAAQASFFERLSAIKLAKGENDIIPVGAVKFYAPPANKDEIRQRALAAASQQETAPDKSATTACAKGKGRKRSHEEMAGDDLAVNARPTISAANMSSMSATPHPLPRPSITQEPARPSSGTVQYGLPGPDLSTPKTTAIRSGPSTTTRPSSKGQQHFSPVPYSLPSSFPPEKPLSPTIPEHATSPATQEPPSTVAAQPSLESRSQSGNALADLLRQPQPSTPSVGPATGSGPPSLASNFVLYMHLCTEQPYVYASLLQRRLAQEP
ncbi:hypothetical protein LTR86_006848 [Recurvomyces mirabilis]|nr:hypothetical protein LTR86_006848 [Recurvomyces mirabilis]